MQKAEHFLERFFSPQSVAIVGATGNPLKMLDMGNKLDINEVDALEYFARDPQTEVIAMLS